MVEVGWSIPHTGRLAAPEFIRDVCQAADDLGIDVLWTSDHVAMPPVFDSLYTLGPRLERLPANALATHLAPNLDAYMTMQYAAAITARVKVGTAVAVLPLRHPVLNARLLATLDVLAGGRLVYGVGVGWLREEAEVLDMPWDRRGERSNEHIEILRAIWSAKGDSVEFHGRYYDFGPIHPDPRPIQQPGPPILIGGHSDAAIRRAARLGDGWIASRLDPAVVAEKRHTLLEAVRRRGRDPGAVPTYAGFDISPAPAHRGYALLEEPGALEAAMSTRDGEDDAATLGPDEIVSRVEAYHRAGVFHLKMSARAAREQDVIERLRFVGEEIVPFAHSLA